MKDPTLESSNKKMVVANQAIHMKMNSNTIEAHGKHATSLATLRQPFMKYVNKNFYIKKMQSSPNGSGYEIGVLSNFQVPLRYKMIHLHHSNDGW